ncbi:T9SS type B sorting domain-containing protein [Tamlana sp. s12]|uniref:T9SS type B sorting domain-containing protein n=1 Tax=Tamlana sp. s12 TaxID=1630406 RepID=UPI000837B583|nr:T9SS type B sorting domain-containing protein [Tamlana sp. s12]QQY81726.1 T9SS type B sorting domain-containing protein [Tamlana sp. s12]
MVPFTPRLSGGSIKVKGDIKLIGNNIITGGERHNNSSNVLPLPYNGTAVNNDYEGVYINEASGGDSSIFSSSSADLAINNDCKQIVWAGLYWSAAYGNEYANDRSEYVDDDNLRAYDFTQVKFKLPNSASFMDITADETIFDGFDPSDPVDGSFPDAPYACFKDVTSLIQGLTDADGTYTIANQHATRGHKRGGCSAGWTLVVIYESPSEPSKFISVFDGFAGVRNEGTSVAEFNVSGFQTLPDNLPVYAKVGVAALEGDYSIFGDSFEFKAGSNANYTDISDGLNDASNFFNSRITEGGAYMTSRNPNSENTMGFEVKSVNIPNPNNDIIPNDETSGTFRLTSEGDGYAAFLASFAVDIIEPNIRLTKVVQDDQGNDIGGQVVNLGEQLNYVLGIENIGNDDAIDLTIRDILPINVNFDSASDIISLSDGITVVSYDPATREIIFAVEDRLVEKDSGLISEIEFSVQVVNSCDELSDACSNIVRNQAYATYTGEISGLTISDDPSYDAINGCLLTPQSTNFLADISGCTFSEEVILCGETTTLTAPDGYDTYSWSTSASGSPVIGTEQTITIDEVGTYYVYNTALAPCQSTQKEFNVVTFGADVPNPVFPYADQIVQCPNDGKQLPYIFLCGGNGGKFIETNLSDTTSIVWETLDTTSCSAVINEACANEDPGCSWSEVGTGPNFMADLAGEYRLTINYPGGCFNRFYFNVYTNLLNPSHTIQNIICNTQGQITVNDVPSGYEYSLDNSSWQDENDFTIPTAGLYTVYIRQKDVSPNPCIFTIPNIQISELNPQLVITDNQPLCHNEQGSIRLSVNDAEAQYTYTISQGGTVVSTVGPITERTYLFENLNAGIYDVQATTDDGCVLSETVELINPSPLTATANVTNITCVDGEIEVIPAGGTAPYYYYINSTTDFQTTGTVIVDTPGVYDITVLDSNNCSVDLSVTVDRLDPPVFTVSGADVNCYGDVSAQIDFNVTNANGYTIEYSIDNGTTYNTNPTFSNLNTGTYATMIRYTLNGVECFSTPENVVIDGPDDALTASAGVSKLAGCGANGEGTVRITNPQGGVPPYEYSFDNQSTWVTSNEAEVLPGTYTLYIRDSQGCIFAMPGIILDPEPTPPTIDDNIDPVYNCDGTANATVNVTNTGGANFEYTYLLNGVENTNTADPTTFLNVPQGSHTISVTYKLVDAPTYSNLLLETFGSGEDTESPGINTAYYCWENQVYPYCKGQQNIQDGDYTVTAHIESPYGDWSQPGDHTSNNTDPKGRALVVNIGDQLPENDVLYKKTINDIIPNQPINFELFVYNLMQSHTTKYDPNLTIALVDASGNEISSFATGNVPKTEQWENYPKTPITLNPGNNTTLEFLVRSTVRQTNGNDVAIDDIRVYQLPESCIDQVDFPIIIEAEKAFTAEVVSTSDVNCFGVDDGEIQIAASNFDATNGYQYSIDGGSTWVTLTTSPYTITGLSGGNYDVQIRYDATSTGCEVSIPETIGAPSEIVLTVDATDITCISNSTISASATGGTAPYSYELYDSTGSTLIDAFPTSGLLTDVAAGDYIVRLTDANNCTTDSALVSITSTDAPTADIEITKPCLDLANGATIRVDGTGGKRPFRYSINNGPFVASQEFTNLPPGTYTITLQDANGCEVVLPTQTIAKKIEVNITLDKVIDCSPAPDARITVNITEGYPPYEYEVSEDNGATYDSPVSTGSSFAHLTDQPGAYVFRITDSEGCVALSNIINVNAPTSPTASTIEVNPSCNGSTDGSVEIVVSDGQAPFEYSFNGSPFVAGATTYANLAEGTYNYTVVDALQCEVSGTVTLTAPSTLMASASATNLTCDASNVEQAAVVTIDEPTTGTSPYQYSFDGTNFSSTRTLDVNDNGSMQTVSYFVQDANGCTATGSLTIDPLDSPTDLDFASSAVTCNAPATGVTVTSTGGVGTLTYEITDPASAVTSNNDGNFTGLVAGTYVFKVTDANGCSYIESYTIGAVTPIAVIARKQSDVLCQGDATGAIELEISGFSGTYSYSVNGAAAVTGQSAATIPLNNLTAGTYNIEVVDEITGCISNDAVTITEPTALSLDSATGTNVFCDDDSSQITVVASGGTPNYGYAAVISGSTAPTTFGTSDVVTVDTNSGTNLVWDVYVEDNNGCTVMTTVTLTADPTPTVIIPALAPNQCTASSGFTFDATGTGVAPLTYSIDGGVSYQSSPTFTVNTPGTYSVRVKDANGCTADSGDINIYEPLTGSAILTKDLTCSTPQEATIELSVSGGNTSTAYAYQVAFNGGTYNTITATSPYLISVDGTYQFKFIDANGCEVETGVITVNPTVPVTVSTVEVDPTCNGAADGSIQLTGTAGEAPFEYSIDGGATFVGTNVFGGLADGSYTYVVRDSKGCEFSDIITLTEPDPIVPVIGTNPIICNSTVPGSFDVSVASGGVAPFEYTLLDNAFAVVGTHTETSGSATPVHTFGGLGFGDYYVSIVDANGCEYRSGKLRIETPPYLEFEGIVDSNNCSTGVDYEVEVTTGGVPPFVYSIFGQAGTATPSTTNTTHTFTGLIHGVTYYFQVEDVNGCVSILEETMPDPPSNIDIINVTTSNVNCFGTTDGNISFEVENFDLTATALNYQVLNALSLNPIAGTSGSIAGPLSNPASGSISNLAAGNYVLQVTEVGGTECSNTIPFVIVQPIQALEAIVTNNVNANCNSSALVTLTTTGGTGPYEYAAGAVGFTPSPSDFGTSNVLELDPSINTNWDIIVRDANGCEVLVNESISVDPLPTIVNIPLQCFDGSTPIIVDLSTYTTGAITPLTFSMGTGGVAGAYTTTSSFSISAAGTYDFFVKDGNGCVATTTYEVKPQLTLDVTATELDCVVNPAEFTFNANGGDGTYTYAVSINGGVYNTITLPYDNANAADYQFRVTDGEACEAYSQIITVDTPITPTHSEIHTNVSCNGGNNGSITITGVDGIAPFEYSIDGGTTFQASNVFDGLVEGNYDIAVRDSKSCESMPTTVAITQPDLLQAGLVISHGLECGPGNNTQGAVLTASAMDGTAPYLFSFNGGGYTSTNTFTTNLPGTVTVTVKDANGCLDTISIGIPDLVPPSDLDFAQSTVTCNPGQTTSDVTITNVTDGVAPYSYQIIAPASAIGNTPTGNVFTGLAPDTYTFRVVDANGCFYDESYQVLPAVDVQVTGIVDNDVSCFGGNDGAATFTVANVPTTYTASFVNGTGTIAQSGNTVTLTGLIAGNYTIQITDDTTGCTDTADFVITERTDLIIEDVMSTNVYCSRYDSQITVTVSGGTTSYSYQAVVSGGTPAASDYVVNGNVITVDTNNGANLVWDVYVQDANGCTEMTTHTILEDEAPSVTVDPNAVCSGTSNGFEFTATNTTVSGVPPFEFSIGNGFQSSATFTGLTPGDYTVTIKDGNGCTANSGIITVYPDIQAGLTIVALPTCGTSDGEISVTASGGSGSYGFELFDGTGTSLGAGTVSGATSVFNGLSASIDYDVVVTDNITSCTQAVSTNLEAATPVSFTSTSTDVSCNGGDDGTITVTLDANQDNPIYKYEIIAGPVLKAEQTSNVFSDLLFGSYTVQVTSERGCVETEVIHVNEPAEIVVPNPTVVEYACLANTNTSNFATITIDELLITGGSGNYAIYEFVRNSTVVQRSARNVYTETDLLGGSYDINVYDDKGCSGTISTTINPFISIEDLTITVNDAITCTSLEEIQVAVTATGGTPNLEYTVVQVEADGTPTSGGYSATNSTGLFTGLDIANYLVTVENIDTNCFLRKFHYVSDPNTFDLTIDNVVDLTCFGGNDGAVNVTFIDRVPTPTDEAGAFTYSIVDALGNPVSSGTVANAGPETLSGLEAGTYTITATLTNRPECEVSKAFTITGPTAALTALETHTEITCDLANGIISASATGGWPGGYEYQLEKVGGTATAFGSTFNFTGLDAGDYNVNVRDSSGCVATTLVTLVDPTPIAITAVFDPASALLCYGDATGIINVTSTGGQGSNYTYVLNRVGPTASQTGPQTGTSFTGLTAGTYNVTVTDGWNCTATSADITITEPTTIQSNLVITKTQTCAPNSTTLTLSATGGTGPYVYSVDDTFTTVVPFISTVDINVGPGTYQYYIRDANGCATGLSNEVKIDPLVPLTVDIDATNADINCYGDNTGVIVAKAQGGLGNYTYTLQDASGNDITPVVQNSPGVFTELVAGDYQVYVTSGVDCEVTSVPVTISEPSAPLTAPFVISDVACAGGNDGSIEVMGTGGTGIIKYAISPQLNQFFDSGLFEDLAEGVYQVVVQDEAGCFEVIDFTIGEPTPVILTEIPTSIIPEVCAGDLNGAFSVNITGGTAPYSVTLDDINGNYVTGTLTQTQFDFTGLAGGNHTVYVVDAQGCDSEWEIDFPESVNLNPTVVVEYDCLNNTSTNRVIVSVDDSVQDLSLVEYSLNGGPYQASNIFIDVPGGFDQYVDVRHANGCIKQTRLFDVDHVTQLEVLLDEGDLNQIVVTATGGVAPYEYSLNGGPFSSTDKFLIYESGDYTVTVRDFYGCEASGTGYFEFIDVCIPNYFTPNGDNNFDGWGPGCATQYKDLIVQVFDRYGRKLAELKVNEKWDGTYEGKQLPSGDYWYVINLNDPNYDRDYVGHFTLYR